MATRMAVEYAFVVRSCELPFDVLTKSAEAKAQIVAEKLAGMIDALHASIDSFDNGGWEVRSHNLIELNGSLVVTFLVCREHGPRR